MPQPGRKLGLRFTETMRGHWTPGDVADFEAAEENGKAADNRLEFTVTVSTDDLDALITDDRHPARMDGTVTLPALDPAPMKVSGGAFRLLDADPAAADQKRMHYDMSFRTTRGEAYRLEGVKHVAGPSPLRIWAETTTLYVTLYKDGVGGGGIAGRGIVHILPADFARQMTTLEVPNAANEVEKLEAVARFSKFFGKSLFEIYGGIFANPPPLDPDRPPRPKRPLRAPAPEVHYLRTSDGLDLRLIRYRGGNKGPLLMVHGLGVSSLIFTIDTIDTNLVEYFTADGYDVWLLDYRASIDLPHAVAPYDADDVAAIDYPEAIDKVCSLTGAPSLQCLVHCYGATTFFMAMLHDSARVNGMRLVRSAAVSQVATHAKPGKLIEAMAHWHVPNLLEHVLGVETMNARTSTGWFDRTKDFFLRFWPGRLGEHERNPVSRRITFLYGPLYELPQLNHDTYWDGLARMFGVAGIKHLEHLTTMVRAGHVVTADGEDRYLPNVGQFSIPVHIVHGEQNRCWLPESTAKTVDLLRGGNGQTKVDRTVVPGYGHIDCVFGKDAARDVYPIWHRHLEKTATV
jgi:cholesterol oxidase